MDFFTALFSTPYDAELKPTYPPSDEEVSGAGANAFCVVNNQPPVDEEVSGVGSNAYCVVA